MASGGKTVQVCVPLYGYIPAPSVACMISCMAELSTFFSKFGVLTYTNTYLHLARTELAKKALANNQETQFDYVFWLDSDIVFSFSQVKQLYETAISSKADLISGVYYTKQNPIHPVVYQKAGLGYKAVSDLPENKIIEVDAVGFGFLLMKTSSLQALASKFGLNELFSAYDKETNAYLGEDFMFCKFAKQAGLSIKVNTGIQVGHAGMTMEHSIYQALKKIEKESKE
ncbi:MAG: hypothetical protein Q7S92_01415 [Candidatus Diapherotrites archaeon]|nr:hypothetical protein [Candidatus Diapherotrites archaeon]